MKDLHLYLIVSVILLFSVSCSDPPTPVALTPQSVPDSTIGSNSDAQGDTSEQIAARVSKGQAPGNKVQNASEREPTLQSSSNIEVYRYRKYTHVTTLYSRIARTTIDLCVQHNVPPAAILSIIALESGWDRGYISQISGNIMSLNAGPSAAELPALTLPVHIPTGTVIFDPVDLEKYDAADIKVQQRPPSLKKDYRPAGIAGTTSDLTYFKYHQAERTKANNQNITDFIAGSLSERSSIAAFREARRMLDDAVAEGGDAVLFTEEMNKRFIHAIGGKPNSFNFRETWPKKVINIMANAGVVELTRQIYIDKKTFAQSW